MSIHEISKKVELLARTWEDFQNTHNRSLDEIKKRESADCLTLGKLEKLNKALDIYQDSLTRLEKRPFLDGNGGLNRPDPEGEYRSAFCHYLRTGSEMRLAALECKMDKSSIASNQTLGFSATRSMLEQVKSSLEVLSPLRKLANVTEISSDALELIQEAETISSGWSEEGLQSLEAGGKSLQLSKKVIAVYELYAQPKVTQKLIDDPRIDIEAFLADKLSEIFHIGENDAFINGDGVNKPTGILTSSSIKTVACPKEITEDALMSLFFGLGGKYASNAKFLMSRSAMQAIRTLKEAKSGRPLWQPSLAVGTNNTLLGAEVVVATSMPEVISGKTPIVFGDFRQGYQIVDRGGIKVLRDPFTQKPFVKFYATKRVGGDILRAEALRALKISG